MNSDELFTRAVALLPGAVRERLDGDFPIDWAVLEDAATGAELGEAVRVRHRLPEPVELLVHRLIRDVGIVPADLAAGVERQGAATAWIHWVTLEADGESYQLRNDRTGDVRTDIRPEAVAGYATLGIELATAVHDAAERWLEAGEHHRATAEDERSGLAQCAVRMHAQLRAQPDAISGHRTAASLARTLEFAWNTQRVEVRAALSGIRLSTARGACAPRRSHYVPVTGYRLHACDAGEIRWMRGACGAGRSRVRTERPGGRAGRGTARRPCGWKGGNRTCRRDRARFRARRTGSGCAGSRLRSRRIDARCRSGRARARRDACTGRGPAAHGRGPRCGGGGGAGAVPEPTGSRRASLRIGAGGFGTRRSCPAVAGEAGRRAAAGHRCPDPGGCAHREHAARPPAATGRGVSGNRKRDGGGWTSHAGRLVEQVRLSLAYAHAAWAGLTALRNAGKEGEWALNESHTASSRLSASHREMLEAAREIGQALDGIRRSYAQAQGQRPPSALEQAAMAAEALARVGPTVRTAAGWPGAAQAPNARDPADVARIAAVAESLHGDIRAVANRLIAGWVAEAPPYGENQNA